MEKESIAMFNALAALYTAREEEARKISEHIIKLTKEHDALMSAAKLALDALGAATTPLATDRQEVLRAIEALRQAGVQ